MIDVAEILCRMSASDVRVTLDGDGLRVIAPTGTMTDDRVAYMRQHRKAIIDHLRAEEINRSHTINLRAEPEPDEPDSSDPKVGRRIIEDIRAGGAWVRILDGRIVLRWRGNLPDAGALIDRIREARTAVVLAAHDEDIEYDRLEREAIQNESSFDNARPPGDDSGTIGD